ncbi:MAG: hypothetical protein ACI8ZB_000271 [Desulforhopalus sp.]|jgi:hypothetical protein
MSIETELVSGKEKEGRRVWPFLFSLLACVLVCAAYYQFMVNTAVVEVEISVDRKSTFVVYWAAEGDGYSERRLGSIEVHPGKEKYSFYLTDISNIAKLRVDTHTYAGDATLKRLVIKQEGYSPLLLSDPESFNALTPVQQIAESAVVESGLMITSSGEDPHFELVALPHYIGLDAVWLLLRLACVAGLTFAVVYCVAPLVENFFIVPVLLFGVWLLVLTMAGISKQNAHPDEYVHIAATSYYSDHWLPPQVDDPDIRETYSVYGFSRLNSGEIYYLLAGKTYKIAQMFHIPETLGYRLFNVFLFGFIFFLSIRNVYARIAALPYLVSSQVWYVFSYCDSDAFSLFVSFLVVCQLINPSSILHRYLKGEAGWLRLTALGILPLVLGAVFLLKMNYYPFVGIFYLVLGAKIFFTEEYYWEKKDAIKRLVLLTILGLSFLGIRIGVDYAVNGVDRSVKISALHEKFAAHSYKKSTPAEERITSLYMKDKGVELRELVGRYHWDIKTFHSSFGVFGYLTITSPQHYYRLIKWVGWSLLVFVFVASLIRGGWMGAGMTLTVCGASVALIGAALYHCWVLDFQAQGRYLFPIVPMFGLVLGQNIKVIDRRLLVYLVGAMSFLGMYSFIFYGLYKITKIPF